MRRSAKGVAEVARPIKDETAGLVGLGSLRWEETGESQGN